MTEGNREEVKVNFISSGTRYYVFTGGCSGCPAAEYFRPPYREVPDDMVVMEIRENTSGAGF